ncbi:MAG TPA: helix-turn-helix domain-containing protein [Actinomycetota bacterium]
MLAPLAVSDADRAELERRVHSDDVGHRARQRALVVLLAADGLSNREISRRIGLRFEHVGEWRRRYRTQGLSGLDDRERAGRPFVYGKEAEAAICRAVCEIAGNPTLEWWTIRDVWKQLSPELGISVSQVRRICIDLGLKPGVPVLFVGLPPFSEEPPGGGAPAVPPLYVEAGGTDPWPEQRPPWDQPAVCSLSSTKRPSGSRR